MKVKNASSGVEPAENDGDYGEQREGRQDAGDEGEDESNRDRPGPRLGTAPGVGSDFGCQPGERGRGR